MSKQSIPAETTKLSANDLADVKARVERVVALVKRSATAWLEVAREFANAKDALKQHVYERFVNDAGFTKAVADKLISVGKCKPLFGDKLQGIVTRTDGWSTLYELTKLQQSNKLDGVAKYVSENPTTNVTRSVVQNIASEKAPTEKTLLLAKIVAQESAWNALSASDQKNVNLALSQVGALMTTVPSCVQFVPVAKSVDTALAGISSRVADKLREEMKVASAHVLARVQAFATAGTPTQGQPENEKHLLRTTQFQFSELKRVERKEAKRLPYDPTDRTSIEHPEHPFSLKSGWTADSFQTHLTDNQVLLEADGIPDRPEWAQAWTEDLAVVAASGKPAEKRASTKALKDIVAGEKRARVRGNISKATHARTVLNQLEATGAL